MSFNWPPKRRDAEVTVVFPASNISILPDLRTKTYVLGLLGRSLAIYRVDRLVVLKDEYSTEEDINLIKLVLTYLQTPPYLRKKLIPILPDLRYCGVLNPLSTVTHNPEGREPSRGDLREGIVTQSLGKRAKVFIGYRRPCITDSSRELHVGERVLVRVVSTKPLKCVEVRRDEIDEYIGFEILSVTVDELPKVLANFPGVAILTSKEGASICRLPLRKSIVKACREAGGYKLLFGNYELDFDEIVPKRVLERLKPQFKVNFIPAQGTYTVRTLEAVNAVLAIINADHETFRY